MDVSASLPVVAMIMISNSLICNFYITHHKADIVTLNLLENV